MKAIRLRLGGMAAMAAGIEEHDVTEADALTSRRHVRGATVYLVRTDEDSKNALAILYYIEAAPAFWTGEGQDPIECSAVRRTSAAWRKKLGLGPHDEIPVPASAQRDPKPLSAAALGGES